MPKYTVTVRYTMEQRIQVHSHDGKAAAAKACQIVDGWRNVVATEPVNVVEQ